MLCFVFFLSSFTSETTIRRGTIRAREEILKERVKRERILCSIFFDRKEDSLAERETRRSVVVQDWKKRRKLRENLNLNTHHIIKRIVTSSSL